MQECTEIAVELVGLAEELGAGTAPTDYPLDRPATVYGWPSARAARSASVAAPASPEGRRRAQARDSVHCGRFQSPGSGEPACQRAPRYPCRSGSFAAATPPGGSAFFDACFDDWKLVVEIDGAHHAVAPQMSDDTARQNDVVLAGYVMLHYPVFIGRTQPQRVAAEIRAALIAAGWRP